MAGKANKQLDKCRGLLSEVGLTADSDNAAPASVAKVVRTLLASVDPGHAELTEAQIDNWARCISDLTLDRSLAVEALRLGVLPALPRFLDRYKNKHQPVSGDVGWSDALIALHNFALLEDAGFPDALGKLAPVDLRAIAANLARALKPGLYPSDARDAAARLAIYENVMNPLIDAGVLAALINYAPVVKPFNRLPPGQWGAEALREINNTLFAIDQLLFAYVKQEREADMPADALAGAPLTSWVCDVLHGAAATDPALRVDIEFSRVAALECLTSLLINASVCRKAVPANRSMLFRVASAITGSTSISLLSAAAQVLAQALSEGDLVPPSELASLHTYDLVRHLSHVLDQSRDFRDLLNVVAALQNILDPAHFQGNSAAMKKVAERLVACSFEECIEEFMRDPRARYDVPPPLAPGMPAFPSEADYESLVDAGQGALDNTKAILKDVGPIQVTLLPKLPPLTRALVVDNAPIEKVADSQQQQLPGVGVKGGEGGKPKERRSGARKAAQNVPAEVVAAAAGTSARGQKRKSGASDGTADGPAAAAGTAAAPKAAAGPGRGAKAAKASPGPAAAAAPAAGGSSGGAAAAVSFAAMGTSPSDAAAARNAAFPVQMRVRLEKELRMAASIAAPMLSAPPFKAVLEWFNEWGTSTDKLESELGTDVHIEGGGHRQMLQDAIEHKDAAACIEMLGDILQLRLPPLKGAAAPAPAPKVAPAPKAAPAPKEEPPAAAPAQQQEEAADEDEEEDAMDSLDEDDEPAAPVAAALVPAVAPKAPRAEPAAAADESPAPRSDAAATVTAAAAVDPVKAEPAPPATDATPKPAAAAAAGGEAGEAASAMPQVFGYPGLDGQ